MTEIDWGEYDDEATVTAVLAWISTTSFISDLLQLRVLRHGHQKHLRDHRRCLAKLELRFRGYK